MKLKLDSNTLKFAGGALVVLAAALIVLPGLLGYFAKLWRLGLIVLVAILLAWGLALVLARISVARQRKGG